MRFQGTPRRSGWPVLVAAFTLVIAVCSTSSSFVGVEASEVSSATTSALAVSAAESLDESVGAETACGNDVASLCVDSRVRRTRESCASNVGFDGTTPETSNVVSANSDLESGDCLDVVMPPDKDTSLSCTTLASHSSTSVTSAYSRPFVVPPIA